MEGSETLISYQEKDQPVSWLELGRAREIIIDQAIEISTIDKLI